MSSFLKIFRKLVTLSIGLVLLFNLSSSLQVFSQSSSADQIRLAQAEGDSGDNREREANQDGQTNNAPPTATGVPGSGDQFLQGFTSCDFRTVSAENGEGAALITGCLRDILIFVTVVSIFIGAFQVAIAALNSFTPGSGSEPYKVLKERLINMLIGLPLMGGAITILWLINPASTNLNFLDLGGISPPASNNSGTAGGSVNIPSTDTGGGTNSTTSPNNSPEQNLENLIESGQIDENSSQEVIEKAIGGDLENTMESVLRQCQNGQISNQEVCDTANELSPISNDLQENTGSFNSSWPKTKVTIEPIDTFPRPLQNGCQDLRFKAVSSQGSKNYSINVCSDNSTANYFGQYNFIEQNPTGGFRIIKKDVEANQYRNFPANNLTLLS
jgi:hypothetical protein